MLVIAEPSAQSLTLVPSRVQFSGGGHAGPGLCYHRPNKVLPEAPVILITEVWGLFMPETSASQATHTYTNKENRKKS